MQEPYGKAVAPRTGPEPWRCGGDAATQASAGKRAGWVLSREIFRIQGVEAIPLAEDPTGRVGMPEAGGPCAVVDPMHVRRLSVRELGGPAFGRDEDGVVVRAVNPQGARR
jgi:hypothetical protein